MNERKIPKIFEIDYLINSELSEDDLYHLFETESLNYSIIYAMHRYLNEYTSIKVLSEYFTKDNTWLNRRHFHTVKERNAFIEKIEKAIKNIYQYSDNLAKRWVDDWMLHYGFTIKERKK